VLKLETLERKIDAIDAKVEELPHDVSVDVSLKFTGVSNFINEHIPKMAGDIDKVRIIGEQKFPILENLLE
jgi:hypothetical protein